MARTAPDPHNTCAIGELGEMHDPGQWIQERKDEARDNRLPYSLGKSRDRHDGQGEYQQHLVVAQQRRLQYLAEPEALRQAAQHVDRHDRPMNEQQNGNDFAQKQIGAFDGPHQPVLADTGEGVLLDGEHNQQCHADGQNESQHHGQGRPLIAH